MNQFPAAAWLEKAGWVARALIPEDVQDAIRAQCGDRRIGLNLVELPANCRLQLPPDRARAAAPALRGHSELLGELRLHSAVVTS